jgi:hypothetical protein
MSHVNNIMIASHSVLFGVLVYLTIRLFLLLRITRVNARYYGVGSNEFWHFFEHVVAAVLLFSGSLSGAAILAVHTATAGPAAYDSVEVALNLCYSIMAAAASVFVNHMIKEETPGHPFYHFTQNTRCMRRCDDRAKDLP